MTKDKIGLCYKIWMIVGGMKPPFCIYLLSPFSYTVPIMIKNDSKVTFEYTLYDLAGNELDSSRGLGPPTVTLGQNQLMPALEQAMQGLKPGEKKQVELTPDQAFGPVVETAFREVPLDQLPEDSRQAGAVLGFETDEGTKQVYVSSVEGERAVLDFNHPLAGKDVVFEVYIIDVDE